MTFQNPLSVRTLLENNIFRPVYISDETMEITGGFCGDLISHAIDKAQTGDAWLTVMTNHNIMAPASIAEVSCLILCDGIEPTEILRKKAEMMQINLLRTDLSEFDCAVLLSQIGA